MAEVRWDRPTEPVVFRWHHKGRDRIPREVLLHGSWDDRAVRLVPDGEASNANNPERVARRPPSAADEETVFITIVNLPPGTSHHLPSFLITFDSIAVGGEAAYDDHYLNPALLDLPC